MPNKDLLVCWKRCSEQNWDGYDAMPVSYNTYCSACEFAGTIPSGHQYTSVGAEPDGSLTIEWYRSPKWTLSVSVNAKGVTYAALLGEESICGKTDDCAMSDQLLALIRNVLVPRPAMEGHATMTPEQTDRSPENGGYKQWIKRITNRLIRRKAKSNPEDLTPVKRRRGYTT